ncbi:MAG: TraR/DksA C4-type zinc finger protein [Candidatus Hydrogenedentales bacterium]
MGSVLSAEKLELYRQTLLQRQRNVDAEIEELAERCEPVEPDVALGRLTRNDAMQDQQMALHQRKRLVLQQTQIQTALERVDKGAFGMCLMCKVAIDPRRLALVPESPLCVACLEKRDAARRRMGR